MKRIVIVLFIIFMFSFSLFCFEKDLGDIKFPYSFVFKGKTYDSGTYNVNVKLEGNDYYFYLYKNGELQIKEMAVVMESDKSFSGVRKEILKNKEYFRIRFYHDNKYIMGYFLIE